MDKAAKRFFTARKQRQKTCFTLVQAAVTFSALLTAQQLQLLMQEKTVVQLLILRSTLFEIQLIHRLTHKPQ